MAPSTPAPSSYVAESSSNSTSAISRMCERAQTVFANRREWGELFGNGIWTSFSRPHSLAEATARARSNIAYFRGNYAVIVAAAILLSFVKEPSTLLVVILVGLAWGGLFFWRNEPLVIFGRTLSNRSVLAGLSAITFLAVIFSGVFWNIFGAVLVGLVFVVLHAVFRNVDDVFVDEESAAKGGFLSEGYAAIPSR